MNTRNQKNEIGKKVKNKKVVIYGGGNVAMDTSRTLKRMGADVTVVYRRSEKEMPAEVKEIEEAKKEKINLLFQTNIIKPHLKDRKIECIKTELIKKENEKRLSPTNIEGSNFYIEADYLILAIGSKPDKKILKNEHIEVNENGYVIVDNSYLTSINNVYAGGDLIGQKATVAWAAKSGREAAYNIINNLEK